MIRKCVAVAALSVAAMVSGCASTGAGQGAGNSIDPLEPMNRAVFAFNQAADDAVIRPVAKAYDTAVPELFRFMIRNFFSNIGDVWIAANQLLQGKPSAAISDLARVLINSTLGFAGVSDPASEMGFEKHNEDFGQTLGRWGIGTGPYLVLPIFGPSNLRDGIGLVTDYHVDPIMTVNSHGVRNNTFLLRGIDTRASLLKADRVLDAVALDKYSFMRDGYLQRRMNLIWDGNPPETPFDYDDYRDDDEAGQGRSAPRARAEGAPGAPVAGQ